jgi:hypothetical protein
VLHLAGLYVKNIKAVNGRLKNRPRFIWHMIKKSAKKRELEFNLPFEEFKNLIIKSGYIDKAGRKLKDYNIDRKDGNKGYTMDNIQVITKQLNLKKYHHNDDLPF